MRLGRNVTNSMLASQRRSTNGRWRLSRDIPSSLFTAFRSWSKAARCLCRVQVIDAYVATRLQEQETHEAKGREHCQYQLASIQER